MSSLAERFVALSLSRGAAPIGADEKSAALRGARAALEALPPGSSLALTETRPLELALLFFTAIDRGFFPVLAPAAQRRLSGVAEGAQGFAPWPSVPRDESVPGYGCFTSGSTAAARVCALTVAGAAANARGHAASLGITSRNVVLQSLPLHHSFGVIAYLFTPLETGCALDFNDSLLSVRALAKRQLDATVLHLSPAQARWMGKEKATLGDGVDAVSVGAGLLEPAEWEQLASKLPGARRYATYGLTEAGPRVTTGLVDGRSPSGFIGRAIAGVQVKVLTDAGAVADRGVGRLLVETPSLKQRPEAHELHGGWLVTRDRVELSADGSLVFVSREADIVKVGGLTFYARDLEAAARALTGVTDCAALVTADALHDDAWDLLVAGDVDSTRLWADLRERLEPAALPRSVHAVPRLERTALGKLDRAWASTVLARSSRA